jgi:glutathione S-transferase
VTIYHIAFETDWVPAAEAGEYRVSTRGKTLDEQGFIHASDAHQVAGVANVIHRQDDGLVVLEIDVAKLRPEVRYEGVPDSDEQFPHIYGPLNVDAVVAILPLTRGPDGSFVFPDG